MTYQTTYTNEASTGFVSATLSGVATLFRNLGHAFIKGSPGQVRLDRAKVLEAKSDAELAQMGLKREDITRHVFRDLYYI